MKARRLSNLKVNYNLISLSVRSMRCHAAVKTSTSREKTISFSLHKHNRIRNTPAIYKSERLEEVDILYLVYTVNQTHKFTHAVAVIVWGAEGVLRHNPSRRKDHKVEQCNTGLIGGRCQY